MENIENYSIFEGIDYGPIYPVIQSTVTTISSGSREPLEDNLSMSPLVQAGWTLVFAAMIFTAVVGNSIVIWVVIAHRRMRTITNYFLVNLSVADLLLSTLNCTFNFIYMLQGHWQFGRVYCTVNNFIANVTVAASVFTLMGITCDRYLAIVHPLQPKMSKTVSIVVIIIVWSTSMVLAYPCLLYSDTIVYRFKDKERTACLLIWPDGTPTESNLDYGYQITFLAVTYVVPMILMLWCYTAMGLVLWGSKSIGEKTQRQIESINLKRKVVKMFIFIVTVFCVCWLPYHSYFIYTHIDREVVYSKYVQHVYLGFYWFAMANAMVNPLIYYWMNARFRQYYTIVLCSWRRAVKRSVKGDSIPIVTFQTTNSLRSGKLGFKYNPRNASCRRQKPETCRNTTSQHSIKGKTSGLNNT
ncbi:tachykinin-like peptides receptor 86C [Onthophagus taurus]|uniref:tachykinin-like peptides receptor 86C n=1 Tax=Onthophagus taurus TaxID=166361 RepID=UPI000C1FF2BD|nr:tachykinin-like peptides receptor 86C [Onthophagus taurus]